MQEIITNILTPIALFFVLGCYFFYNRSNTFSKAFSHGKYDPRKVSYLLGVGSWGIALSCVPSLLAVILQKTWLNMVSVIILTTVIIYVINFETKGNLK